VLVDGRTKLDALLNLMPSWKQKCQRTEGSCSQRTFKQNKQSAV